MSLAQAVYWASTDVDFAARLRSNPEATLAERGLQLAVTELASLLDILQKGEQKIIVLAEKAMPWGW